MFGVRGRGKKARKVAELAFLSLFNRKVSVSLSLPPKGERRTEPDTGKREVWFHPSFSLSSYTGESSPQPSITVAGAEKKTHERVGEGDSSCVLFRGEGVSLSADLRWSVRSGIRSVHKLEGEQICARLKTTPRALPISLCRSLLPSWETRSDFDQVGNAEKALDVMGNLEGKRTVSVVHMAHPTLQLLPRAQSWPAFPRNVPRLKHEAWNC